MEVAGYETTPGNMGAIALEVLKASPDMEERVKEIVKEHRLGHQTVTVRAEMIKCGKGCSKCPHGPYIYAYWKQDGKTRKKYIGKAGR